MSTTQPDGNRRGAETPRKCWINVMSRGVSCIVGTRVCTAETHSLHDLNVSPSHVRTSVGIGTGAAKGAPKSGQDERLAGATQPVATNVRPGACGPSTTVGMSPFRLG